jgi:hypothetical protein
MENQHRLITGYRELSQEEIDLMNDIKQVGQDLEALIWRLLSTDITDNYWVGIGRTDCQTGIMALVRSVAKPRSF